jgi:5-methylcytosine-specific restriction endonuclease McrA
MGGRGVPSYLREIVIARDGLLCRYCGRELIEGADWPLYPTLDHIVPRSQGGDHLVENLAVCCQPCNQRKKDRTPEQAEMELRPLPAER